MFDIYLLYHTLRFGYGIIFVISLIFFIGFLMYVVFLIVIHAASLLVISRICIMFPVEPMTRLLSSTCFGKLQLLLFQ